MSLSIKNLLDITPETLAQEQLRLLKIATKEKLLDIVELIDQNKWDVIIDNYLELSPGGDEMGLDNFVIHFNDCLPNEKNGAIIDLFDVIKRLQELEEISKNK
jgi:hypothetical protein